MGSVIADGLQPQLVPLFGARCDIHTLRFAFNLVIASDGSDIYLSHESFLDQRMSSKRHGRKNRRPKPTPYDNSRRGAIPAGGFMRQQPALA